jgi:cell division protein FtsI (penicillin-binding protein 3)
MFVAFMLAFSGMAFRLVTLQIVDAPAYAQLADDYRKREVTFAARRGTIFDRNGEPLAISVEVQTVYADPALVDDPLATAEKLAGPLELPAEHLAAKLAAPSRFEYLARQIDPAIAKEIKHMDLAGIFLKPEAKRYYPNGRLAAHTVGFVDVDGIGLAGIEVQFDEILQGKPGLMTLEQDAQGRELPQGEYSYEAPRAGRSLYLTIDKELQYFTELTLGRAVEQFSAAGGTAIVMRPGTGEILALANAPAFDLNEPGEVDEDDRRNRGLGVVYEPGSAFKIVTAAAALEEHVVTPRSTFVVPDTFGYQGEFIHDSHAHATEKMTVTEIIRESSNIGTVMMALKLGGKALDEYIRAFGFGSATGLDFPTETAGIVLDRDQWSGVTIANLPIGQGIAVTPVQMAAAYATLANGGVWVEPKLVSSTIDFNGKVKPASEPGRRRVISRSTNSKMVKILSGVVEEGGTGTLARIPGYEVAGKTGTAQKPLPSGGYGNLHIASFAGFAPASRPAVVVLVVLDEPSPIWGGLTAAPTFKTITEFALRHLGIPPTGNAEKAAAEIEAERGEQIPAHD